MRSRMTGQGRSPVTLSAAEGPRKLRDTTAAQSLALLKISSSKDLKKQNHKPRLASQKILGNRENPYLY